MRIKKYTNLIWNVAKIVKTESDKLSSKPEGTNKFLEVRSCCLELWIGKMEFGKLDRMEMQHKS